MDSETFGKAGKMWAGTYEMHTSLRTQGHYIWCRGCRSRNRKDHRDHQPEAGFWSRSLFQKISIISAIYEIGHPTTNLFFCSSLLVDLTTHDLYEEDYNNEN